jgi:hypothetical protein
VLGTAQLQSNVFSLFSSRSPPSKGEPIGRPHYDNSSYSLPSASMKHSSSPNESNQNISDLLKSRACGDLLMTQSAEWWNSHLLLPFSLYPRTLVIAGTLSLMNGIGPSTSDGTVQLEETKLPIPPSIETELKKSISSSSSSSPTSSGRYVTNGPLGCTHISFHAQHSILLAHPGVIRASLKFLLTGTAEERKGEENIFLKQEK